jgi:hypothetical protein
VGPRHQLRAEADPQHRPVGGGEIAQETDDPIEIGMAGVVHGALRTAKDEGPVEAVDRRRKRFAGNRREVEEIDARRPQAFADQSAAFVRVISYDQQTSHRPEHPASCPRFLRPDGTSTAAFGEKHMPAARGLAPAWR